MKEINRIVISVHDVLGTNFLLFSRYVITPLNEQVQVKLEVTFFYHY